MGSKLFTHSTTLEPWPVHGGFKVALVERYLSKAGWEEDVLFYGRFLYEDIAACERVIEEIKTAKEWEYE